MNPKNIFQLLKDVFEHPVYDFDSIITTEERHFASSLESLIKDAIYHLLVKTFDTLASEHENKRSDPVIVEEEFDNDFEEKPEGDTKKAKVPITTEYKTSAVEFWRQGKIKSLKTVQHRTCGIQDFLRESRLATTSSTPKKRGKKLAVSAGKGISVENFNQSSSDEDVELTESDDKEDSDEEEMETDRDDGTATIHGPNQDENQGCDNAVPDDINTINIGTFVLVKLTCPKEKFKFYIGDKSTLKLKMKESESSTSASYTGEEDKLSFMSLYVKQDVTNTLKVCASKLESLKNCERTSSTTVSSKEIMLGERMTEAIIDILQNFEFNEEDQLFLQDEVIPPVGSDQEETRRN
ncbi:hypothetical protein RN001_003780 [Aquatica leii]|uniref:Uncharacterized protein n=1 Tax=Aquatica leii TaxID=1421715 RepID=A0AAN7Q6M9_9COLE|nr:hypothetical protein RN001_003780 [Aquatica leii]